MTKKQHYMTYPERIKLETMLRFQVAGGTDRTGIAILPADCLQRDPEGTV